MKKKMIRTVTVLCLIVISNLMVYAEGSLIIVMEEPGEGTTYYLKEGRAYKVFEEAKKTADYPHRLDAFTFLEYKDSLIIFSLLFGRKIAYGKMSVNEWVQLLDLTRWPNEVYQARAYQFGTNSLFYIDRDGASEKFGSEYVLKIDNQKGIVTNSLVLYDSNNKLQRAFNGFYPYAQAGGNSSFFFSKISFFDYNAGYWELAIDGHGKSDPINGYGIYSINKDMKIAYYSIKDEIVVPGEKMNGVDVVPCLLDKVNPGFTVLKSYYDSKNEFKVKYRTFKFDYEKGSARFVEEGYIGGDYRYAIYELPRSNREYPTILKISAEDIAKMRVIKFEEDGTQERIHRGKGMLYVVDAMEVKNAALFERFMADPPVKELTYEYSDFRERAINRLDK